MWMARIRKTLLWLLAMALPATLVFFYTRQRSDPADAERDRQVEQLLSGATLVGRSTTTGRDTLSGEERYVIESVTRLTGDSWLVRSRFQYREREIPIVVPVQIRWAGDTPVLGLTDFAIPGMGTFSARVVFFRGEYAGTWSAVDHGGQMFGRLESKATAEGRK
jgi:hypothetical protein